MPNQIELSREETSKQATHRFHTRHDFTPDATFELYGVIRALTANESWISHSELKGALELTGSPLRHRQDLSKVLASMEDLGLIELSSKGFRCQSVLTEWYFGQHIWRRKFVTAVHALYALGYHGQVADPRWSYREVCRVLVEAGPFGISADELVVEIVYRAHQRFGVDTVSFSRSSVGGIKAWLTSLDPPILEVKKGQLKVVLNEPRDPALIASVVRIAALLAGGFLSLDADIEDTLGAALLLPPDHMRLQLDATAACLSGILILEGHPRKLVIQTNNSPPGEVKTL